MTISTQAVAPALETIRVLSVQQPHADCIIYGGKWCENRSWQTKYRGELWIHASRMDTQALEAMRATGTDPVADSPGRCQTGAIIGRVHLHGIYHIQELELIQPLRTMPKHMRPAARRPKPTGELKDLADMLRDVDSHTWQYVCGEFCWILTDPQPLAEPIPCGGKLNIWKMDVDPTRLVVVEESEN